MAAADGEPAAATDEGTEAQDPQLRIEALEIRICGLEREARENYDRFLRERADLENFKRRAARERAETLRFGTEALVRDLLPVVDNLERALDSADEGGDGRSLREGVHLVRDGLIAALKRHGVEAVVALGERFDPSRHEAMEQVVSDDHEPGTVLREHQKGYTLHERLLRPSLVAVSKRSFPTPEGQNDR